MQPKYDIYDKDYSVEGLQKIYDDRWAGLDKDDQEQKVEATMAELSNRLKLQKDEQDKANENFLKVQEENRILSRGETSREAGEDQGRGCG